MPAPEFSVPAVPAPAVDDVSGMPPPGPRHSSESLALAGEDGTAQRLAVGFLLSHHGNTRAAYTRDLSDYGSWCAGLGLEVLDARRVHIDAYVEHLTRDGAAPSTVVRASPASSTPTPPQD
ncbi:hypothetical protein [Yinghuangia soli]|uniref:Uncharacterized protein n=1 Tax=Yinghuangia soli TaxID=2908204 RepID=A0AA41PY72_9ACTN|nr:hypothetical protein [Yinghuangia soli]MCF2527570.1 hypothetical protein [Yinghuangia soli]